MQQSPNFDALTAWPNLFLAWRKASRGKRGTNAVAGFELYLEDNLFTLQQALRHKVWRPGDYTHFYIHDPKRRLISAAPFADRIVHHALCNCIEPCFERVFIETSFANRLGKGNHRALDYAQCCAKRFPYVLALDIRQFFPGIDHQILRTLLANKIEDQNILDLIDWILASGADIHQASYSYHYFSGDDLLAYARPTGLPIGNLTSQFWANVYLNPLDQYIKGQLNCQAYVRYVDDLLLFADDKIVLWQWLDQVSDFLAQLRLKFHRGAHPRPVTEGISFLGFRIFPAFRRLKRRKGIQYQRQLKTLIKHYHQGNVDIETIVNSLIAWNNHAGYGDTFGLRKKLFGVLPQEIAAEARRRMRIILWRKKQRESGGL